MLITALLHDVCYYKSAVTELNSSSSVIASLQLFSFFCSREKDREQFTVFLQTKEPHRISTRRIAVRDKDQNKSRSHAENVVAAVLETAPVRI